MPSLDPLIRAICLIALTTCGGGTTKPAPPTLEHLSAPTRQKKIVVVEKQSICGVPDLSDAPPDAMLYGAVCDERSGVWLEGATVTATSSTMAQTAGAITNSGGVFWFQVPPGDYSLTIYDGSCTAEANAHVEADHTPPLTQSIRDCSQ